jgi:hypothetical protein
MESETGLGAGGGLVSELASLIEHLRASGAVRVRVGDVEVQWAGPPTRAVETDRPVSLEERQTRARDDEESLLFAASG